MPKTTLGIRIGAREAVAVHLKGGWRSATVDRLIRVELPPHASPEERGVAVLEAGLPRADAVITALPADAVFPRVVTLPFTDRARLEQAAPLEAEESLPLALEEVVCHVQVLRRQKGASSVLLAAAPETRVTALLDELRASGLEPRVVDVEALALGTVAMRALPAGRTVVAIDLGPSLCQAVVVGPEGPLGFHAFSSQSGEATLPEATRFLSSLSRHSPAIEEVYLSGPEALAQDVEAWAQALGLPVRMLPFPSPTLVDETGGEYPWPAWAIPLGLALREGYAGQGSQVNLLQGNLAPGQDKGPWKGLAIRGGAYALTLLALWGLWVWRESAYRGAQYQVLRDEIRQVFREALPNVTNVVSEIDQMRSEVRELESRAASLGSLVDWEVSPLRVLREISTRIPPELEVEFRDFTVEEGRVRVEGVTTSFDSIDKIKADLADYPRFVSVTVSDAKAGVERDKVIFKLTISLNREG